HRSRPGAPGRRTARPLRSPDSPGRTPGGQAGQTRRAAPPGPGFPSGVGARDPRREDSGTRGDRRHGLRGAESPAVGAPAWPGLLLELSTGVVVPGIRRLVGPGRLAPAHGRDLLGLSAPRPASAASAPGPPVGARGVSRELRGGVFAGAGIGLEVT